MRYITLLFFISVLSVLSAQVKPLKEIRKPIGHDCPTAIPITINTSSYYGPTEAPEGFGEQQEIRKSSPKLFDEEHNSAWYILNIARNGELVFEIIPKDTSNDYDFALFRFTDSITCENISKNKIKPLRSNLSNLSHSNKGITGLRGSQKDTLIGKGPGSAFSNSMHVKKGEKYILILDNVTPKGEGHTIFFNFIREIEIKGKVINSDSIPIVADITLSDNKGNVVEETTSNESGEYSIKTDVNEGQNYNLSFLSENTFVQNVIINTNGIKGKELQDIKTVLPKLKKGEKYKLGNINFYGNAAVIIPESYASVEALYKLMKKNKHMIIEAQGHVNDPTKRRSEEMVHFDQTLSESRAESICNYLIKKGIDKDRLHSKGFSNTQMLFPNPQNQIQDQANRRVEIKVVSIE